MATESLQVRRQAAMQRCDEQIAWYTDQSKRKWRLYAVFQSGAVLLGAVTPVLILWSTLPKAVQALPAALASVAAGLVGTFRWLENKTRWAYTSEALKSERVLFTTRTPPRYGPELPDDAALAAFVSRIEEIAMTEVSEWRAEFTHSSSPDAQPTQG